MKKSHRTITAAGYAALLISAHAAAQDDYRIRTVILGIVKSTPFNQRKTPEP